MVKKRDRADSVGARIKGERLEKFEAIEKQLMTADPVRFRHRSDVLRYLIDCGVSNASATGAPVVGTDRNPSKADEEIEIIAKGVRKAFSPSTAILTTGSNHQTKTKTKPSSTRSSEQQEVVRRKGETIIQAIHRHANEPHDSPNESTDE